MGAITGVLRSGGYNWGLIIGGLQLGEAYKWGAITGGRLIGGGL